MRFTDKVALITGGASGIGAATAVLMAREGARVALIDVARDRLSEVEHRLTATGAVCEAVAGDVLDPAVVEPACDRVVDRFGRIDVLVNAVGGSTLLARPGSELDELSLADWQQVLEFNLRGTFLCTQAVIPHMKRRRAGRIVLLSSIVARGDASAARTNAPYVVAKAGIRALARKLALELGPFGITCNAVAPGVTLTERIQEQILARRTPEQIQQMIEAVPLRRLGTPEDQARVIAFLASDDAAFVSGQTIDVTGGQ